MRFIPSSDTAIILNILPELLSLFKTNSSTRKTLYGSAEPTIVLLKMKLRDSYRLRMVSTWGGYLLIAGLSVVGAAVVVRFLITRFTAVRKTQVLIPISKSAGPERNWRVPKFVLNKDNSRKMTGINDPVNERWCDIAGNFYSSRFISDFNYEKNGKNGPVVRVRIYPEAVKFSGRIEARGLKPNFAYQLKLRGVFSDHTSFEIIGFLGRWRLPGRATNYSDKDYLNYPDKEKVRAYIFFDYFVTDSNGNAAREFALDSSLHILWNAARQRRDARVSDLHPVVVYAGNQSYYARPKKQATVELLWTERERIRYMSDSQIIRLPPRKYQAELWLTEESFHAVGSDGGFWATVYSCPVSFTITAALDRKETSQQAGP